MTDLSTEAKVVIGAFWGVLMTSQVVFHRPHILTRESRKGLDELVEKGFLTVEIYNKAGGICWKPTEKMKTERPEVSRSFMEEHSFPLTTE